MATSKVSMNMTFMYDYGKYNKNVDCRSAAKTAHTMNKFNFVIALFHVLDHLQHFFHLVVGVTPLREKFHQNNSF